MSSRTVFPHWFSIYFKVHPKLMENHQEKFIFIWCIPSKAPFFHLRKKQSVQLSSFYIATIRSSKHWQVFYKIMFPEMFLQSAININDYATHVCVVNLLLCHAYVRGILSLTLPEDGRSISRNVKLWDTSAHSILNLLQKEYWEEKKHLVLVHFYAFWGPRNKNI